MGVPGSYVDCRDLDPRSRAQLPTPTPGVLTEQWQIPAQGPGIQPGGEISRNTGDLEVHIWSRGFSLTQGAQKEQTSRTPSEHNESDVQKRAPASVS